MQERVFGFHPSRSTPQIRSLAELGSIVSKALGDRLKDFRASESPPAPHLSCQFKFQYETAPGQLSPGVAEAWTDEDTEGTQWVTMMVGPAYIDQGAAGSEAFSRQVVGPLARELKSLIALEDDGVGRSSRVVSALEKWRLPLRSETYFLSRDYVEAIGRDLLEKLLNLATAAFKKSLREWDMPENATMEMLQRAGYDFMPRPYLEWGLDGSALIGGLYDGGDYWDIVGL